MAYSLHFDLAFRQTPPAMLSHPLLRFAQTLVIIWIVAPVLLAQQPDTTYARLIRENTTDSRYLNELVNHLPDHPDIPSLKLPFLKESSSLAQVHIKRKAARNKKAVVFSSLFTQSPLVLSV